jgi:hypothetical protein
LDAVEQVRLDDGFMASVVFLALVDDDTQVVAICFGAAGAGAV